MIRTANVGRARSMRRQAAARGRCALALLAVAAGACIGGCGDSADPAPGPSGPNIGPDGIPVWEHVVLPLDGRGADRIELVTDAVIGDQPGEVEGGFYGPQELATDGAGKLYVVDVRDRKLRVFDRDGNELYALGSAGKGPGELMFPHPIAVAGDRVVVNDRINGRLSVWDVEGNFIEDHAHGRRFDPGLLEGLPDGSVLAISAEQDETGTWLSVVARYAPAGEQIGRWATFPTFGLTLMKAGPDVEASSAAAYNEGVIESSTDRQLAAVDTTGQAYVMESADYAIRATDSAGDTRWRLHAPFERLPYPVAELDRRAERSSRRRSEQCGCAVTVDRSDYVYDEFVPALDAVRMDGHGHLWVFPTVLDPAPISEDVTPPAPATRPVDVYSTEGELLYSGEATNVEWEAAFADFVYRIERDPETDEQVVVRYRLVEPF